MLETVSGPVRILCFSTTQRGIAVSNQNMQVDSGESGGGMMARVGAHDEASALLSSELGLDWDTYIQETLQPITARLRQDLSQLIQPEVERMSSAVEHMQEQLVTAVKESLAQQVPQALAVLRRGTVAPQETASPRPPATPRETPSKRPAAVHPAPARKPSSQKPTPQRPTPQKPTPQKPASRAAGSRPPLGQPPPGPGRKRTPPKSSET